MQKLTRRDFVRQTSLATSVLSFDSIGKDHFSPAISTKGCTKVYHLKGGSPEIDGIKGLSVPSQKSQDPDGNEFTLMPTEGEQVPVQTWNTASRPDGSLKCSAIAPDAPSTEYYEISAGRPAPHETPIHVEKTTGRLLIDAGILRSGILGVVILCLLIFGCQSSSEQTAQWKKSQLLFEDTGTRNWQENWMLDGTRARVINSNDGMELIAGPEHGNDTCHTVLWTKQSFEGNICIEYDYTRTDTATRCVNILYFLATGKGDTLYPTDISLWNDKRRVPHMRTYYNNMNTYHISYAAYPANQYSGDEDYIRMRRYMPDNQGLDGTEIAGDHFTTGLFKPNETYHIEVFKYNDAVEMHIQNKVNKAEHLVCKWDLSGIPPCDSGRIGLRHMYTRSARYKDVKVWEIL